jgi:YD repeat-containing protein
MAHLFGALELGRRYEYAYDLNERLRQVRLPDGTLHSVQYDGFGRLHQIDHSRVGSIAYEFDNEHNRVARKIHSRGKHSRVESFEYDSAGLVTAHTFTSDSEQDRYEMAYSGGLLQGVRHREFAGKAERRQAFQVIRLTK